MDDCICTLKLIDSFDILVLCLRVIKCFEVVLASRDHGVGSPEYVFYDEILAVVLLRQQWC